MSILATLVQLEGALFLGAVALVVLFRLVRAEIDLGQAQLSRLQLLVATIGFAAYYLSQVDPNAAALPEPGAGAVAGLGSSMFVHLANKLWRVWPAIINPDGVT